MRKIIALSAIRKMGAKRSEKQRIIKKILTHMSEDFFYYSLFFASFSAHFSDGGKCDDFTHLFIVLL